ncbi:MAG TPA: LptE family protein [Clostridia bacterium]|nr:LptE family protein [Clostridia bacterium]
MQSRKACHRAGLRCFHHGPWALCLALLLLATGCASYKLGPTNGMAAGSKSVQVAPFLNQTLEPRLTDAITMQLRKELQRDATYKLATQKDGDILLSGVVLRYQRFELSLAPEDVLTVRDYRLLITAQVTARERGTGKMLLNRPVNGVTLIRVGSDLTSAERQALPLLAADLSRNIVQLLADGSW